MFSKRPLSNKLKAVFCILTSCFVPSMASDILDAGTVYRRKRKACRNSTCCYS